MIFKISKPNVLLHWILLSLLTACTPPNYAPVKTVNQVLKPDNGYINEKPLAHPENSQDASQNLAKTDTDGQNKNLIRRNSVDNRTTKPNFNRTQGLIKPPLSPQNTNSNPKSRVVNHEIDKKPAIKNQQQPSPNQQPIKLSKNKPSLANTGIFALHSGQQHKFQPPDESLSTPKNNNKKKSSISIDNKKMLKLNFGWPIRGKISKNFSQTDNKGIDIAGKVGQSVRASEAGKAVYCGQGLAGFGNLVIIKHNETYLSAYAHNSRLLIKEGQQVTKGQTIGQVGLVSLKKASLHFEIRKNGKSINPLLLLPKH
jgi:murein DD-endopeptidase MepM/ murein hydrolase activator NlpD